MAINYDSTGKLVKPKNVNAEELTLGCIFFDPVESLPKVMSFLNDEDFYLPSHQTIYKEMKDLYSSSREITAQTVIMELKSLNLLEKAGDMGKILDLDKLCETSVGLEDYAWKVKSASLRRKLIESCEEMITSACKPGKEIQELLGQAEEKIFSLSKTQETKSFEDMGQVIDRVFEQLEHRLTLQRKDEISGVPSGFRDLDTNTTGWQKSDLIILASRPAMGKTAMALNIVHNAAVNYDNPILIFSLEMSSSQLGQRLLCMNSGIASDKLRHAQLSDEQWARLTISAGELHNAPIYICDSPGINMFEIRSIARQAASNHKIKMIIIDYIQLITPASGKNISREQELSRISRHLKILARELDIPVIALAQLSRKVEDRTDKRPLLSDLRESGAIEQDADIVLFLFRDEYYTKDKCLEENKGVTEVIISKHRNGPVGTVKLYWRNDITRFENYARDVWGHQPPV
ncbi:replicative DNA helicase [Candidatus Riflebacteria bacterium]